MDGLMMDWLYDELDPSSSAQVAQHVDGCSRCSTEMAALRRTREAFRGMSHLEPPAAISAILLHEAARRSPASAAAARAATGSRFRDRLLAWFRPIGHHPALAAMASLVLVAGVAGALYVRRGWDIGAPHPVPDVAPADSPAAAPAPAPPTVPGSFAEQGESASAAGDEGQAVLESEESDRFAESNQARPNKMRARAEPEAPKAPTAGDGRTDGVVAGLLEGEKEADLRRSQYAQPPEQSQGRRQSGPARTIEKQKQDVDQGSPPADDQKINKRGLDPSTDAVGGAEGGQAATGKLAEQELDGDAAPAAPSTTRLSKSEQGWLTVQEQKLTALARGKRCREAAAIANDILDRNPEYYVRRIRDSKDVEPCRRDVGVEQKRRAARRAKAPASKQAGGGGQKTKAAPARDEAAEQSTD